MATTTISELNSPMIRPARRARPWLPVRRRVCTSRQTHGLEATLGDFDGNHGEFTISCDMGPLTFYFCETKSSWFLFLKNGEFQ